MHSTKQYARSLIWQIPADGLLLALLILLALSVSGERFIAPDRVGPTSFLLSFITLVRFLYLAGLAFHSGRAGGWTHLFVAIHASALGVLLTFAVFLLLLSQGVIGGGPGGH